MGIRWDLSTAETRANFDEAVNQALLSGKRVVVEFVPDKRSLPQNDMIHGLYREIAAQKEDESVIDIERECKLRYGVPILRACNLKFKTIYDKAIKSHLSYEEKLIAMDILPVTRLMDKAQASEYIDIVIREYSRQGITLAHPDEHA